MTPDKPHGHALEIASEAGRTVLNLADLLAKKNLLTGADHATIATMSSGKSVSGRSA